MPKSLSFRSGLGSILFWSVISAAFIGPGTVTTCLLAGSRFGLQLLWALSFSTIGTIILQEAAARITIASGLSLGQVVAQSYGTRSRLIAGLLLSSVIGGCAAYQAGNILGAVSGLSLITAISPTFLTAAIGAVCVFLLWRGSTGLIAQILGTIVFVMGIAFAYVATRSDQSAGAFVGALVRPVLPTDSFVLVIGLIGTTIVPYNLFLASGIGREQSLAEMRWGIGVAILIGGLISMAILVSGTLVTGEFSFRNVADTLANRLGIWSQVLFAFGLFAAGFTSALTAPLAAAVTAQSLMGWGSTSWQYRLVWLGVMGIGLIFGLLNARPVPVIIVVQAINGILLPVVTIFLFQAVNSKKLIPDEYRNSWLQNVAMLLVVGVSLLFGGWNVWLAVRNLLN
ncbi:Nramp family divalent metal transporter [Larkinella knui]|uniref:Divalent metal cation transporter n=1 Tax=Larkinella knui TaxID=2025310 RepID=A0A3P1CWV2_9BACT|nr:divalent metal cation transporter [Larkinella knui]RRB17773.1 divalent metal cation transporter [Larkinella knui]